MKVLKVLHELSSDALSELHKSRREAVWASVGGVLRGGRLWLSYIGRHIDTNAGEKHAIKRVDRLLGNKHLCSERVAWYRWIAQQSVGSSTHPIILVDWSNADLREEHYILRAALAVGGRALPLYEEVVGRLSDPQVEKRLLHRLAGILPQGCCPIIVSDAGFRTPWFRAVESMGWYYVGRVRHRNLVCPKDQHKWFSNKDLYEQANTRPKCVGEFHITKSSPFHTRLFVYKGKPKGRKYYVPHGTPARKKPGEVAREPWLLATNLPHGLRSAHRVVAIYRRRMQIEESFRDLKSPRCGFALRQNLGRDPQRIANLLLLCALAMLALWVMGLFGYQHGHHRLLQANTEKRRRVLSVVFVGKRLIAKQQPVLLSQLRQAIELLRASAIEQLHNY